jgi:hypothetical protein
MPQFNQSHAATFETADDIPVSPAQQLTFKIVHQFDDGKHNLGKFRLSVTDSPRPVSGPQLPADIQATVDVPPEQRTPGQQAQLKSYYLEQDVEYQRLKKAQEMAAAQTEHRRLTGVQDLAWALINTPAFLFNR